MIFKGKYTVYRQLITIFNQVQMDTRLEFKYFQSKNVGEYQELQAIF